MRNGNLLTETTGLIDASTKIDASQQESGGRHEGVPPPPSHVKFVSNNFSFILFCGLIALKHIVYDTSNSQLTFWLS